MSLFLKSCPKCKGDVYKDLEKYSVFIDVEFCLQCGYRPNSDLVKESSPPSITRIKRLVISFLSVILAYPSEVSSKTEEVMTLVKGPTSQDVYRALASVVYEVPPSHVDDATRTRIKNLVLRHLYS